MIDIVCPQIRWDKTGNMKLTTAIVDFLVLHIKRGVPIETAYALAGIDSHTWASWCKKGNQYKLSDGATNKMYFDLLITLKRAAAYADVRDLDVVDRAAQENLDWRAALAKLSRRNPRRFGTARVASENAEDIDCLEEQQSSSKTAAEAMMEALTQQKHARKLAEIEQAAIEAGNT